MIFNEDGTFELERHDVSFPCPKCKSFSQRVNCTDEERKEFGCGRSYDCCSRAFVCTKCGYRFAMSAPAPEME